MQAGDRQFLIATHSPILLSLECAQLLSFDTVPVSPTAYRDTEHFKVYKAFFSRQDQEEREQQKPKE